MCRLFGFRSVIQSQVHHSLVSAENALSVQSRQHPDGWGVAYYVGGAPHLVKSAATALSDTLFHRVSGVVASETVLAHIRKATQGELTPLNAHPFQFGTWIFAHNGNVEGFLEHREALRNHVRPEFRRYVLGTTDSELLFYLVLSRMSERGDLHDPRYPIDAAAAAMREAVDEITALVGPFCTDPAGTPDRTYLSFLLTNCRLMLAHQGGKPLYYSTWKKRCPERDTCPSFAPQCEMATRDGFVNHLVISSEPLHGENVWLDLAPADMVGVDQRMRLRVYHHGLGAASI